MSARCTSREIRVHRLACAMFHRPPFNPNATARLRPGARNGRTNPWPAAITAPFARASRGIDPIQPASRLDGLLRPAQAPAASLQRVLLHVQRHPTELNAGAPRALLGARSQSFQPGISGDREAATAALASANAACNAASFVWSREVFSTVPPSPLSLSSTLSAVTLRTSTKSAAVPGGRAGWRHEYRRARVEIPRRKGLRRLRSRRQCIPTPTDGLTFKTHRTR